MAAVSVVGALVSSVLFFFEIFEWYSFSKYEAGGTAYTYSELRKQFFSSVFEEPVLFVVFVFAVLAFIAFAIIAGGNINKYKAACVTKLISAAAYYLAIATMVYDDVPGEGLEIFIAIPPAAVTFVIETVLLIVLLSKNKNESLSLVLYSVFVIISVVFTAAIAELCWDYAIYILAIVSAVSAINLFLTYRLDENLSMKTEKVVISVLSVILAVAVGVTGTYVYHDRKDRAELENEGGVYVGNDGLEKERAAFNINGYIGYYAYSTGGSSYVEYRNGDICIITGYDFSSRTVTIPAELDGKQAVIDDLFFKCLAENRESFDALTVADGAEYKIEENILFDGNERLIKFYFGDEKSVVIPSNVVQVCEYSFAHSDVESVTFNEGTEYLRNQSFADCPIKELTLTKGLATCGLEY